MAFFGMIDTKALEEFSQGLASDLIRRFPPSSESRNDPGAVHQLKVILEGLSARAIRFKAENGLGVYRKAKLGTVFKYKLREASYSPQFVDHATGELIKRISVN